MSVLHLGVPLGRLGVVYSIVDKLGREEEERTRERLYAEAGLDEETVGKIFGIFEHEGFEEFAAAYRGVEGLGEELDRLTDYFEDLAALGIGDYARFDPTIVRGLACYTGIAFEVLDRAGDLLEGCGRGRYDDLLAAV